MRLLPALAIVTGLVSAHGSFAQSLRPGEVFSVVEVRAVSEPNPVLGADDRVHLAYELLVVNASRYFAALDRIEAVDEQGNSLLALAGDALAAMTNAFSAQDGVLPPGASALVFMDVSVAPEARLPQSVAARVTTTRLAADPDGKPQPLPADAPFPATSTFTGAEAAVGAPAVVIAPPLRGPRWLAMNGCCDSITSHRGAVMAIDGRLRAAERFAIDWVQLDEDGRIFAGDVSNLGDYPSFGASVHSVAEGTVVNLYDGIEEQVPGQPVEGVTIENAGGNIVVVDIGGGAYAFYAHLEPGSLTVGLGDRVARGEVLGRLGNTGNSTAPHLHFHVMDSPSPLNANGLPYVFERYRSRGFASVKDDEDPFGKGDPVTVDARLAGDHAGRLPLDLQVVDFD